MCLIWANLAIPKRSSEQSKGATGCHIVPLVVQEKCVEERVQRLVALVAGKKGGKGGAGYRRAEAPEGAALSRAVHRVAAVALVQPAELVLANGQPERLCAPARRHTLPPPRPRET